jgi:hypothetical protein
MAARMKSRPKRAVVEFLSECLDVVGFTHAS